MKNKITKLALLLPVIVLIFPLIAVALTPEERKTYREAKQEERKIEQEKKIEEKKDARIEKICERFSEVSSRISEKFSKQQGNFQERQEGKEGKLDEKRSNGDQELIERRETRNEARQKYYEKLEAMAKTDAQKTAVDQFKEAIEAAVNKRRDAVDEAKAAFREGVDAAVANRKTAMEKAVSDFESARTSAVEKAKSSCDGTDIDMNVVQETLKSDLKTARDNFKAAKNSVVKVGDKVSALAKIKNDAVKVAIAEFENAMKKIRSDLKAVLGSENAESENNDNEKEIAP